MTTTPRAMRRARIGLVAALAVFFVLLVAVPAAADSPSPDAGTPAATATTPAVSPGTSTAPCPNPSPSPSPTPDPAATATPAGQTPTPHATTHPNLCPAVPGSDLGSTLAWLFTPIFQVIFLALVIVYRVVGDIGVAIIVVTILIRLLLVPMFRRQIVSTRRMQAVQPELKALQARYKNDKQKLQAEQMRFYKERGVNPLAGCLPSVLQLFLLMPMYSVFSSGLSAPDISSMLHVFGVQIVDVTCQAQAVLHTAPCIHPNIAWLGGLDASQKEIFLELPRSLPIVGGFGLSALALVSAFLQLVQTRMMTPSSSDPQTRAQSRAFLIMPLFSVIYGAFLPSGLFIYWITTTIFSIVQQYLIAGFGALFPLFGWTPAFVTAHQPRFPVMPAPVLNTLSSGGPVDRRSAADRAAGTVRPSRERARTSRRGRRR
ncbi:MAG: YidC/Oxa1 family membrane protein insertase [Candidatus Limnocylindrales bacterium]